MAHAGVLVFDTGTLLVLLQMRVERKFSSSAKVLTRSPYAGQRA